MRFPTHSFDAPSRPAFLNSILLCGLVLGAATIVRGGLQAASGFHASAPKSVPVSKPVPAAVLDTSKAFPSSRVRFLGFADQKTALFVAELRDKHNHGEIVRWDVQKARVAGRLSLSPWLRAFSLRLSPDGKYLATTSDPSSLKFRHAKIYRVTVLNSADFKVMATHDISEKEFCAGVIFPPGKSGRVLLKMRAIVPQGADYILGHGYWKLFDIKRRKVVRSIPYHPGYEADRIVALPGGKSWLALYYNSFFDNFGAAGADDEMDQEATIDVMDPASGKIRWHIASTEKTAVGEPVIPISSREFISSGSVFNSANRTSRPWVASKLRSTPDSPIYEVPGKPQFVVLVTEKNIKIRNWIKGKDVASWPTMGNPGRTFFSPDLKAIAYKQDEKFAFFKFDPTLLK